MRKAERCMALGEDSRITSQISRQELESGGTR